VLDGRGEDHEARQYGQQQGSAWGDGAELSELSSKTTLTTSYREPHETLWRVTPMSRSVLSSTPRNVIYQAQPPFPIRLVALLSMGSSALR
jgi:hypothetical protein